MNFTLKKAKKVEQQVCDTLNDANRGIEYTMCKNDYSHFDLYGVGKDKHFEIIEVKQRKPNSWPTWIIEERKIKNMFAEIKRTEAKGNTMEAYLVKVCDGKMYMYDIHDIAEYPVITRVMNEVTATDLRKTIVKVEKSVYEFPKTLNHIVL